MKGGNRLLMRLQGVLSTVLLLAVIGLAAWLTYRYHVQLDWTSAGRNTLSRASSSLIEKVKGPIRITAYARREKVLRESIRELVDRYRRVKPDITLEYVDPDQAPAQVRRLGIRTDGELVIEHAGRSEHVQHLTESGVTNAIGRLVRTGERWIVYLTGHGERDLLGQANFDLGRFGAHLKSRGFKVQPLTLADAGSVPANTSVLVVSQGEADVLPGEARLIVRYLDGGGNLLWLADPGPLRGLGAIAKHLGVRLGPGTIVDPTTRIFGIDHPDFVVISHYGSQPITRGLDKLTVFPQAAAVAATPPAGWSETPLLRTARSAWSETGPISGQIRYDAGQDVPGPLDIGVALTRSHASAKGGTTEQRVAVIGDGDFLSNTYLGNGGNLDLGLRLVDWLAHEDRFIEIPPRVAPDAHLDLRGPLAAVVGLGALIGLPALLLAAGALVWTRRRRR